MHLSDGIIYRQLGDKRERTLSVSMLSPNLWTLPVIFEARDDGPAFVRSMGSADMCFRGEGSLYSNEIGVGLPT